MTTKWTRGARADLLDLIRHIKKDRPAAARKMASRIRGMVREASRHPELGRVVPELDQPGIRERIVRPYRIVYLVEEERVVVLGIVHGRRLMPSSFDQE